MFGALEQLCLVDKEHQGPCIRPAFRSRPRTYFGHHSDRVAGVLGCPAAMDWIRPCFAEN